MSRCPLKPNLLCTFIPAHLHMILWDAIGGHPVNAGRLLRHNLNRGQQSRSPRRLQRQTTPIAVGFSSHKHTTCMLFVMLVKYSRCFSRKSDSSDKLLTSLSFGFLNEIRATLATISARPVFPLPLRRSEEHNTRGAFIDCS
jgi:hypothetical protein